MSPLDLQMTWECLPASSIEIEVIIKIQPIAGVDDTILCRLGWSNLEFLNKRRVGTYQNGRGPEGSQTQMYYEYGIFSTIYGGEVMPTWITHRRKGPSISFTIPSSPNKLRGLNLCYVQTLIRPYWRSQFENGNSQLIYLPYIKIRNITKNLTWLYKHYLVRVNVGGKSLTFLSHWMFGENEMEDGDQLTISIFNNSKNDIRECGVSFVYDGKNEKEEDPLSYYNSWNHINGGDLSPYQLTTQEYNLNLFITHGACLKDKEPLFKAFSPKNSNTRGRAIEVVSQIKYGLIVCIIRLKTVWMAGGGVNVGGWRVYDQMPKPRIIPVNIYVSGCPPTAEALLYDQMLYMRRDRNKITSKASILYARARCTSIIYSELTMAKGGITKSVINDRNLCRGSIHTKNGSSSYCKPMGEWF
nr:hypothetical protein [Tanacetum cinerariifolium]